MAAESSAELAQGAGAPLLGGRAWDAHLRGIRYFTRAHLTATRLFVLSFLFLILAGTSGILFLPGLYVGERLGFIDALFTATSAVCVTGLIVVDTATYFTPLGQVWIAFLIQLGGLGILTFTTLLIRLVGGRAGLHVEEAVGGAAASLPHLEPAALLRAVVALTFTVEATGALVLWLLWRDDLGNVAAVWPAIFHAISAFCNAGFSVFSTNLVHFRQSAGTIAVISALIMLGGLGFIVYEDLRARYALKTTRRLSVHTRLVLVSSAALLAGGTLLYLLFEVGYTLRELPWLHRFTNAWLMAVTSRTAGFNTVDYAGLSNPALFLTVTLMIIGGSPAGTAGGLKTTTIALLALSLLARLRGERHVSAFGRTLPDETIQRAAGLMLGGVVLLGISVFALTMTELPGHQGVDRAHFTRIIFEAHSAFGTVGLSMGATATLSPIGRLIIIFLMFAGRVGPLALAAAMALARRRARPRYRYAEEDVVVG